MGFGMSGREGFLLFGAVPEGRAALGWTRKDLANRAGINMNTISRYEAIYAHTTWIPFWLL